MASVGVVRKLFLDSRYKVSGTDADFEIELPVDIDCTRTSSFFVASCSFANTYQTVTNFNNLLYYIVVLPGGIPGGGNPRQLRVAQVATGVYTPQTLGVALQAALGSQSTVIPDHGHDRNVDAGEDVHGHALDGQEPHQQDEQAHDGDGVGATEGEADDPHEASSWVRWEGC